MLNSVQILGKAVDFTSLIKKDRPGATNTETAKDELYRWDKKYNNKIMNYFSFMR